jgi:hypothetical protein
VVVTVLRCGIFCQVFFLRAFNKIITKFYC